MPKYKLVGFNPLFEGLSLPVVVDGDEENEITEVDLTSLFERGMISLEGFRQLDTSSFNLKKNYSDTFDIGAINVYEVPSYCDCSAVTRFRNPKFYLTHIEGVALILSSIDATQNISDDNVVASVVLPYFTAAMCTFKKKFGFTLGLFWHIWNTFEKFVSDYQEDLTRSGYLLPYCSMGVEGSSSMPQTVMYTKCGVLTEEGIKYALSLFDKKSLGKMRKTDFFISRVSKAFSKGVHI